MKGIFKSITFCKGEVKGARSGRRGTEDRVDTLPNSLCTELENEPTQDKHLDWSGAARGLEDAKKEGRESQGQKTNEVARRR